MDPHTSGEYQKKIWECRLLRRTYSERIHLWTPSSSFSLFTHRRHASCHRFVSAKPFFLAAVPLPVAVRLPLPLVFPVAVPISSYRPTLSSRSLVSVAHVSTQREPATNNRWLFLVGCFRLHWNITCITSHGRCSHSRKT